MRVVGSVFAVVVLGSAVAGLAPAAAQDCRNPRDQHTMNRCAEDGLRAADLDLNAQYRHTRKIVAAVDLRGEQALVVAQRAWIAFRDAHCEAATWPVKGGTMEPLFRFSCLARTTEARTAELKRFESGFGN
jgi:uncharacterized protein YecT (DUF1311 family)